MPPAMLIRSARQSTRPARSVGAKRSWNGNGRLGDVGIIAGREIRQRVRGRVFRVGTLLVLLAVAAAIIIPTLHRSGGGPDRTDGRRRRDSVAGAEAGRGGSRVAERGFREVRG